MGIGTGEQEANRIAGLRGGLRLAGGGEEEDLAFVDEVGVLDVRVGVGDAGPGGSMAELGQRDA